MSPIIAAGTYAGAVAAVEWEKVRATALFTMYCVERTELPIGEDSEGFLMIREDGVSLSAFRFYAPSATSDGRLEIATPSLWHNPAFFVSEYSLLGDGVDRFVMTSLHPKFVELETIDPATLFDRNVIFKRDRPRREKTFRFAKSNRKRLVLERFLSEYRFNPPDHSRHVDWLLRNNLVELALKRLGPDAPPFKDQ